ncbi:CHRD domain-containing protein [Pseudochrobactrum asaccharolyticum]|uniref:CHRD domain-containing protein n=1 Tax=Pseudochrobactrum asaccharolyticum TaxID=354351 RepID=UPI0040414B94
MRILKVSAAFIIAVSLFSGAAYAKTLNFESSLSGNKEVPHITTTAKGQLKASYSTISKVLKWHVSYSGLSGAASMAHFHGPATTKQNADVIIAIGNKALKSPIEGSEKLTKEQEKQLLSGHWYFNIHTEKHPGGEIRTQLIAK